jgi:subtilisin
MKTTRALSLALAAAVLTAARAHAQFCPLGETTRRIVTCRDGVSMDQCLATARTAGCEVVRSLPLIHAVVIEIPNVRVFFAEAKLNGAGDVARVETDDKVSWIKNLPDTSFALPDPKDLTRELSKRKPSAAPSAGTSDPEVPWGILRVGAPRAWSTSEGQGAKVAVIDTGIDGDHADLQGQVAGGVNIVDPQHPDAWKDDEGHGTHVSGTIAAKRDGQGVVGVAPKARLYAVKVLDKDGNGNYDDVIAGIQWVIDHHIPIANMSLGADQGSDALHAAVIAARKAGVTIVAAAGNSGGAVGYPGAYPEVLAVGASDSNDQPAVFSSRGPEVDFIAPGVDILSDKLGGGLVKLSGTSMATPHVAGLAALAYAEGARTPDAIAAALDRAAHPIAGLTPDLEGKGLILAGDIRPSSSIDGGALAMLSR